MAIDIFKIWEYNHKKRHETIQGALNEKYNGTYNLFTTQCYGYI